MREDPGPTQQLSAQGTQLRLSAPAHETNGGMEAIARCIIGASELERGMKGGEGSMTPMDRQVEAGQFFATLTDCLLFLEYGTNFVRELVDQVKHLPTALTLSSHFTCGLKSEGADEKHRTNHAVRPSSMSRSVIDAAQLPGITCQKGAHSAPRGLRTVSRPSLTLNQKPVVGLG